MSQLELLLGTFLEKASRPGVLGLPGMKIERSLAKDLKVYFGALLAETNKLQLHTKDWSAVTPMLANHIAAAALHNVLRKQRGLLQTSLAQHLAKAYEVSHKTVFAQEAGDNSPLTADELSKLGDTAKKAADWASEQAAQLVVGLDETTIDRIASAIETGIQDQIGAAGTGKLIHLELQDMKVSRALTIASTEINRAMSAATLDKLESLDIEYKQWILDADPCPICIANADQGPIPTMDNFDSGDDAPPAHPNCRCAVAGARGPDEK